MVVVGQTLKDSVTLYRKSKRINASSIAHIDPACLMHGFGAASVGWGAGGGGGSGLFGGGGGFLLGGCGLQPSPKV